MKIKSYLFNKESKDKKMKINVVEIGYVFKKISKNLLNNILNT